jgi:hypothetical protein
MLNCPKQATGEPARRKREPRPNSFVDLEAKTTMRNVAAVYDAMADRAEERERVSRA